MTQMIGCRGEVMKCKLCGKRINEYGKYSAVIAGKEHYFCVWCYKKTQRNNEILKNKER